MKLSYQSTTATCFGRRIFATNPFDIRLRSGNDPFESRRPPLPVLLYVTCSLSLVHGGYVISLPRLFAKLISRQDWRSYRMNSAFYRQFDKPLSAVHYQKRKKKGGRRKVVQTRCVLCSNNTCLSVPGRQFYHPLLQPFYLFIYFSPIPVAADGYQYKADNQLDCLSQLGLLNMPYVFSKKIYAYSFSLNLKHLIFALFFFFYLNVKMLTWEICTETVVEDTGPGQPFEMGRMELMGCRWGSGDGRGCRSRCGVKSCSRTGE